MGKKMTKPEILKESFKLGVKEGGKDATKRLIEVNPEMFAKMKFLIIVEMDRLLPKNEAFEKALKLEAYDRMIENPFIDQEAVTRDFLIYIRFKDFAK